MNRQRRLRSAAQLIGNAAAHVALYRDQTGVREARGTKYEATIAVATQYIEDFIVEQMR